MKTIVYTNNSNLSRWISEAYSLTGKLKKKYNSWNWQFIDETDKVQLVIYSEMPLSKNFEELVKCK